MTGDEPPAPALRRRRVTAPQRLPVDSLSARGADHEIPDASAVYLGTLIRAQLRLAVTLALGFIVTLAAASISIAAIPLLHVETIFGVPWSWVLQAYGMYPLVGFFALVYVRAAGRNEQRYRSLETRR